MDCFWLHMLSLHSWDEHEWETAVCDWQCVTDAKHEGICLQAFHANRWIIVEY